ncbi:MAG TPA: type II toxin-antitoxin system VapC family toxin [Solirubrobacteraceae bacterium]|nr:type II toxin-antitoxin system VapC family toxin [Solirubrobacteraceae bacterium]
MTWVVDASVAVAYLLGDATEVERRAMLGDAHAPAFVDVEVTQTLRGLLRGSKIGQATADVGREELAQLAVHRHLDAHLLGRCWDLRDVCTIYDGLYVALAEALDATLITRDGPLARAVATTIDVVLAG